MQLTITLKNDSLITKKGPYYYCYCGSHNLGTLNLVSHVLSNSSCGDKFIADLTYYYPPAPKRKWWQKFRKQKKPPLGPIPTLFLPGINKQ